MLSTQDIERIMNRLDKIEEGQKEILKWTAKIDQLTIDHGRRINNLENRFWWFIGLWVAGAVGLFFYTFNGG
ncbi:hypothetical protein EMG21_30275 [Klebsiella pneumoniae]|nr:hypothetical protein EMG21_30275 [Klebsiella pneumoniae]